MARTTGSHSEITGPKVRDTALRLFAKHGYAAVSMRQIAAEVGVQAGALYNYTPDKQALLFGLLKDHMSDILSLSPVFPEDASPHDRLRTFVEFHIAFNLDRPQALFISYMELRNLSPAHYDVIEAMRRTYENRLRDILNAGQKAGAFSVPDTRVATWAVISMLTGVATWYKDNGRLSREEVQKIYWDIVRQAVAG